jgi:hypothetical protein
MDIRLITFLFVTLLINQIASGQDSIPASEVIKKNNHAAVYGYIRAGAYYDINRNGNDPFLSAGFSDIDLKIESGNSGTFKAFADIRYRYGSEFGKEVNGLSIREAMVSIGGKRWNVSAGQQIVKWGRADFTNLSSRFNPQNQVSRSPDREDMDLGNMMACVNWSPFGIVTLKAVFEPFYRPSILIIDPVPMPVNTTLNQIDRIITDQQLSSFGVKADFHLKGIDWSISWFDGYDPMPGIALTSFNLDLSGTVPVAATVLSVRPYKTKAAGFDFEASAGIFGIRGEASWSIPCKSYRLNEYVPAEEVKWVAGLDWSADSWRISGECSGKYIPDFTPSASAPGILTTPDLSMLAGMMSNPEFDMTGYVRQQVSSFNRLFNYQLKKLYYSAGVRIESDLLYGRILPSFFMMYNITSGDLLLVPEVRYKPVDGLTLVAGAEIFGGRKGSLYYIVNDFMNTIYVALKIDF